MLDHVAIEALAVEDGPYSFRDEAVLGTRMHVMFLAGSFGAARDAAIAVRAEIDRLDRILSGHRGDSELSILNRSSVHTASPELFAVIAAAERWREASCGAFSGRLGRLIDCWRQASTAVPNRALLAKMARCIATARVTLDPRSRSITRPNMVKFALDGLAKGWIVDRAFEIAMAMPGVRGALVDIGGDVRCGGEAPSNSSWQIGIASPRLPFENAPLVATASLSNHAIATSGRGARDRLIAGGRFSATLSPFDGWPITDHISTSVIARSTSDADALATALLVLPTANGVALAEQHGAQARIETLELTPSWTQLAQAPSSPAHFTAVRPRDQTDGTTDSLLWQDGWQALATFTAPRRQLIRDPQFRSPYMAMWITDLDNNPVRTLLLVGKRQEWQKDNFIWWSINRPNVERLVATRSMSTSAAGVYNVFWDGIDDAGQRVRAGTYVLHVETSRERGKHTHRSLKLDFGKFQRFTEVLPPTEEGGGLRVGFDRY